MKKILTTLLIAVLWSNTIYANIKNIGNGISIKLPNGYHYFDITLKQIVSRFPSIDISDFTNSEFGIGPNAKLVILANDKKTIKLANDISTVSGLVKLTEDYWEPFLSLEEDPVFMKIIKSYAKKNFSKIDLDNASDEEWQIIFITVFKNNGASLDIAITLYLAGTDTNSSRSCTFFNSKKVSSSILFLSAEGKLIHTFPSSASYQRSIAIL